MKPIDPTHFNDERAMNISWEPAVPSGWTDRTFGLKKVGRDRIEFRLSAQGKKASVVWIIVGASLLLIACGLLIAPGEGPKLLFVFFFTVLGIGAIKNGTGLIQMKNQARLFDKKAGRFWIEPPESGENKKDSRNVKEGALEDIMAIQILKKYPYPGQNWYSCELNLVLKDTKRFNVMDHERIKYIRREAAILGDFLDVPVWDATFSEPDDS